MADMKRPRKSRGAPPKTAARAHYDHLMKQGMGNSEAVYYWGDPLLGGHNRIGLVTLLSLLLGFWQFRTAMLLAAIPDAGARRRQLALGDWVTFAACTAVTAGFFGSRVDTTAPNLPLRYGDQPGIAVFHCSRASPRYSWLPKSGRARYEWSSAPCPLMPPGKFSRPWPTISTRSAFSGRTEKNSKDRMSTKT